MTLVIYSYAIYDEITGAAHKGHFPDLYKFRLSYQTYHFEIERSASMLVTTGIFTRVDYLRMNELDLP